MSAKQSFKYLHFIKEFLFANPKICFRNASSPLTTLRYYPFSRSRVNLHKNEAAGGQKEGKKMDLIKEEPGGLCRDSAEQRGVFFRFLFSQQTIITIKQPCHYRLHQTVGRPLPFLNELLKKRNRRFIHTKEKKKLFKGKFWFFFPLWFGLIWTFEKSKLIGGQRQLVAVS